MSSSFAFGDTRYVDPDIAGIALVVTVIFLAICDYATHCLEELIQHSTIYMSMLQKIYKELMIMGLVSFCLVMYQAAHPHSSHQVEVWIGTFDFVGYVLFFNAIFTVIHALSIICWSMLTSQEYNRFHAIPIADVALGIEILKENRLSRLLYNLNYYPFLMSRQLAEFKVIHVLFRNTFGVPLDFNFGEYLGKCFERYSLNIIKLSVISWIVMFILFGLNMIRVFSPYSHSFRCESHEEKRHLSSDQGRSGCDLSYVRLFTSCSVLLDVYVLCLFVIGRVYTLRLLRKAGVNEISSHEDDLSYFLDEEAAREHEFLLSQNQQASDRNSIATANPSQRAKRLTMHTFSNLIGITLNYTLVTHLIDKAKSSRGSKRFSNKIVDLSDTPMQVTEATPQVKRPPRFELVSNFQSVRGESLLSEEQNIFSITRKIEASRRGRRSLEFRGDGQRAKELKLAEDFSDIYTFQSPALYFRAVEIGIVLNCIYLSLWVSDFIHIAQNVNEGIEYYQIIMAIPFVLLIPLLTQTVKTASLLAAIAALEVDVIAEVLEESEERTHLIQDLRKRLIQRTIGQGLQQRELLESVFKEIDTDGSGEINRSEFRSLLAKMDLGYSGKKFTKLYNAIDRNGDGSLSLKELNHLMFPEEAKLQEVEELGLKVKSRLSRRINALESESKADDGSISLKHYNKKMDRISSLKTLSQSFNANEPLSTLPETRNPSGDGSDVSEGSNSEPQTQPIFPSQLLKSQTRDTAEAEEQQEEDDEEEENEDDDDDEKDVEEKNLDSTIIKAKDPAPIDHSWKSSNPQISSPRELPHQEVDSLLTTSQEGNITLSNERDSTKNEFKIILSIHHVPPKSDGVHRDEISVSTGSPEYIVKDVKFENSILPHEESVYSQNHDTISRPNSHHHQRHAPSPYHGAHYHERRVKVDDVDDGDHSQPLFERIRRHLRNPEDPSLSLQVNHRYRSPPPHDRSLRYKPDPASDLEDFSQSRSHFDPWQSTESAASAQGDDRMIHHLRYHGDNSRVFPLSQSSVRSGYSQSSHRAYHLSGGS